MIYVQSNIQNNVCFSRLFSVDIHSYHLRWKQVTLINHKFTQNGPHLITVIVNNLLCYFLHIVFSRHYCCEFFAPTSFCLKYLFFKTLHVIIILVHHSLMFNWLLKKGQFHLIAAFMTSWDSSNLHICVQTM